MIFFILITFVFLYSFIFYPNRHPVSCIYKKKTGINCPSCGTSRVFSSMLRGSFIEAIQTNKNAVGLFVFFYTQWFWRGCVVMFYDKKNFLKTKTTLVVDTVISFILLLVSVAPFYCA
jgi:hypothetical protein